MVFLFYFLLLQRSIIKFIVEIIIYLQKLEMRDQNYYQRLKQIRQKYGYMDQNNPEHQLKTPSQWNNTNHQVSLQHKNINSYHNKDDHLYMPQKFTSYDRPLLTHNENIYNVQSKYAKKDGPPFQFQDKYSLGYYKKETPSPQKRQKYGYNQINYRRQQINKSNLYDRSQMITEPSVPTQPYHEAYSRKENYIYSSPIKKLAGQQSGRAFISQMEGIRNGSTPNKYQITPEFHPKPNNYSDNIPFKYDRTPQSSYRQSPKMDVDYHKNVKSISPCKPNSLSFTQMRPMSQRQEGNDKMSYKINNIDKIQSKIQSILQKNK